MRKLIPFLLLIAVALPSASLAYTSTCGNTGKKPCKPSGGANPIDFERADVHRTVVDLTTFGNAPVTFSRNIHSRTTDYNDPYWELGARQTWQHNWNFEVRDLSTTTFGKQDVKIRYPGGAEYNFRATDSNGTVRVPDADIGDKLYKWSGSPVGHTLVTPSGEEYDFKRTASPKYRLEKMRNGQGLTWTLSYSASNQLLKVQNDFGRYIEIERQTNSYGVVEISKVRSSDGREVTYGYSDWVNATTTNSVLISATYPDNTQALYTYVGANSLTNGRPLLATASDPMFTPRMGARIKYVFNYNAFFNFGAGPTFVTGIVKEERNLDTDALIIDLPLGSGEYPQILEGDGTEITRIYNDAGQLIEERDGEGRPTYYAYDQGGAGFLTNKIDAAGAATTYVRDYAGRILTEIDALGFTNSFAYNTGGLVITNTDRLGHSAAYTRNSTNLPTRADYPDNSYEEWTYNQYGQPLTHRLRNGGTETFIYYATNEVGGVFGDLKTRTDALGNTGTYTWNAAGLRASITDPRGNATGFTYDWRGQALFTTNADTSVVTFQYDSFGNQTNVIDELGNATGFTFDEYARLKTVRDPLGRVTSYEYGRLPVAAGGCGSCGGTALGNTITKITDPAGKVVKYSYDRGDRRTNETMAADTSEASTTDWTYDVVGRMKSQTDANGHTYIWVYDGLGRITAETNALGQATAFTYDTVGNRLSRTDGAGVVTFWAYDSMNRVTGTGSGTLTYEFGYDSGGRRTDMRTRIAGAITETTTYTYDTRDLLLAKVDPSGFTLSYGYDVAGNRTNLTVGSILSQSYAYDNRNRVTTITGNGKSTVFAYDAASRLIAQTLPNGATITNTLDNASQLLSRVHKQSGGGIISSLAYGYDPSGNRTNMITVEGVNAYTYDNRNWLTSAAYPDDRTQQFFYDAVGNRTNLLDSGTAVSPVAYSYNAANRLLFSVSATGTNTYIYDDAGRLIAQAVDGHSRSYGYDFRSQMISVTDTNATVLNYQFDGDGNRIKVDTAGCLSSRNVYDGVDVVLDLNESNQVVHAYVNGLDIDQHIERIDFIGGEPRTRLVYHTDALGSIVAMTDSGQHTAKSYAYEAFGKIRGEAGDLVINRFTYTAREALGDSADLYYYRARVMDADVGRFISEDPLGFGADDVNLYGYVHNSPVDMNDPEGLLVAPMPIPIPIPVPVPVPVTPLPPPFPIMPGLPGPPGASRGWTCYARCHVVKKCPTAVCPDFVTGSGYGMTQAGACISAKRNAVHNVPGGGDCRARHCRCTSCFQGGGMWI